MWTLYGHTDQSKAPELPFIPAHNVNSFLEDPVHDWDYRPKSKTLKYYSRVTEGGCWLLLEFIR